MVIRKLDKQHYDRLCRDLFANAYTQPLDPTYTVSIFWNGKEYFLKLLPDENCQIAALHALEVEREEYGPAFTLLTNARCLTPLFDRFLRCQSLLAIS